MFWLPALRRLGIGLAWGLVLGAAGAEESKLEYGGLSLRMKTWTTDDGLPQHEIHCLKQTRDGYLWIGTFYGLARFDGMRFKAFDKFNTPEMSNDTITDLAEDNEGALWIGTGSGLLRYRHGRFERFIVGDGRSDPQVWRLAASARGGIWLQSGPRIFHCRDGRLTELWNSKSVPFGQIIALQPGEGGFLNIVTEAAWLELSDDGQVRTNCLRPAATASWVSASLGRDRRECWFASEEGFGRLRRSERGGTSVAQVGTNRVDLVREDQAGNVWVNSSSPLLFLREANGWQPIDLGSQSIEKVTCQEQDTEGNTWLGTINGLVRLRTAVVRSYTRREGLAHNNAWSVCEGTDGTIWVGTQHGLSAISPGGQALNWRGTEPLLDYCDRCVWPNRSGGVLIAKQDEGIYEFQDGRFTKRFPYNSLPGLTTGLWEDSRGRLVIATSAAVVLCRGIEVDQTLHEDAAYDLPDVRAMAEDADGTIWLATKGRGLACLKQGALTFLTERDGLSNSNVWAIHRDAENALWLATDNGLTRVKKGKLAAITERHGLLENTVNCVLEDDLGFFWLSGLHGIYRVEGAQLRQVASGQAASARVHAIGTADGMESPETNGDTQPAGCKGRDGRLWFPTTRGVVVVDPRNVNPRESAPQVVFEEINANGTMLPGDWLYERPTAGPKADEKHRLRAGQGQMLEFKFTVNTFVAPERVRFRWRLTGADPDWREASTVRTATYANLRPGHYEFQVKAANHHNLWSETPALFAFSVAPEFRQTWTFYGLCGAAVIGLGAAVRAYRLRWERRLLNIEQQKALAVERTRIARDLHDDLGTALTGLALELDVIGRDSAGGPRLSARLNESARKARGLAERMREVVWTVNPRCDTVSSLADFLEQQATQFLRGSEIMVRLEFPEDIPSLPIGAEARHQLALSVREGLNNIVRHASATEVVLGLSIADGRLTVQIRDNGKGFKPEVAPGHGLENMTVRMEQAGGVFEIASKPGAGTVLNFRLPLEKSTRPAAKTSPAAAPAAVPRASQPLG